MEKLKQYKWVIIIVFIILSFVFYWFELRSSMIRIKCAKYAGQIKPMVPDGFNFVYEKCLHEKGIEK